MPFPLIPLIAGAASIVSSAIGSRSQKKTNESAQNFARETYQKEKADNLQQWNLQNEYNDPKAQMARLASAGLNPNMVYGNGSAVTTADPVRAANTPSWSPTAPKMDIGGGVNTAIGTYFDTQIQQAQSDNLRAQNELIRNQAQNIAADTVVKLNTGNLGTQLFSNNLEMAKENLRKLQTENYYSSAHNQQKIDINATRSSGMDIELQNLKTSLQLKNEFMSIMTRKTDVETKIKEVELAMAKNGISKSDPLWQRMLGLVLSKNINLSNFGDLKRFTDK